MDETNTGFMSRMSSLFNSSKGGRGMIDVAFIVSNLSLLSDEQLDWLEEEIVHWRKQKADFSIRKVIEMEMKK